MMQPTFTPDQQAYMATLTPEQQRALEEQQQTAAAAGLLVPAGTAPPPSAALGTVVVPAASAAPAATAAPAAQAPQQDTAASAASAGESQPWLAAMSWPGPPLTPEQQAALAAQPQVFPVSADQSQATVGAAQPTAAAQQQQVADSVSVADALLQAQRAAMQQQQQLLQQQEEQQQQQQQQAVAEGQPAAAHGEGPTVAEGQPVDQLHEQQQQDGAAAAAEHMAAGGEHAGHEGTAEGVDAAAAADAEAAAAAVAMAALSPEEQMAQLQAYFSDVAAQQQPTDGLEGEALAAAAEAQHSALEAMLQVGGCAGRCRTERGVKLCRQGWVIYCSSLVAFAWCNGGEW